MSLRRDLGVGVALVPVLIAVLAVCAPVPPAAAGTTGFRTFQHNVQITNIGAINYISIHEPPLIITGQELCRSNYNSMRAALQNRGYQVVGYVAVTVSPLCDNLSGQISMVASLGIQAFDPQRFTYSSQHPGDLALKNPIRRGGVCWTASAYLLAWWACSTHLTSRSGNYVVNQSDEMRGIANFLNDRAVIVGGDFNREPGQTGASGWYPMFVEVDQTVNHDTHDNDVSLTRKIDYIFSMKYYTDAGFGVARLGCGGQTASDHCFLHGYNTFYW